MTALLVLAVFASPAAAQFFTGSGIGFDPAPGSVPAPINCLGFLWCHPASPR